MKILAFGCWHAPFEHPGSFEFIATCVARHKPDLVVSLGDMVDFYSLSGYDSHEYLTTPLREILSLKDRIEDLMSLGLPVLYLDGNHERRVRKHFIRNLPKMSDMICPDTMDLIRYASVCADGGPGVRGEAGRVIPPLTLPPYVNIKNTSRDFKNLKSRDFKNLNWVSFPLKGEGYPSLNILNISVNNWVSFPLKREGHTSANSLNSIDLPMALIKIINSRTIRAGGVNYQSIKNSSESSYLELIRSMRRERGVILNINSRRVAKFVRIGESVMESDCDFVIHRGSYGNSLIYSREPVRWRIGNLLWILDHGDSYISSISGMTARRNMSAWGSNVLIAHSHRVGVHSFSDNLGTKWGIECGCLCRPDLGYAIWGVPRCRMMNWSMGCVILEICQRTGEMANLVIERLR